MSVLNLNESNALLLYRVGPVLVCSPTMPVEAVVMPPKITVPPGASVAEPGVFKSIHGMVRLVDLRVRFGVDENDFVSPGRIVIVEVEGGHAGFWVDEIEDVMGFPGSGWSQVPAYIPKHVFSKTLVQENTIRLYADFENLDKFKSSGYLRQHIEMLKANENEISKITSKVPEEITPIILTGKDEQPGRKSTDLLQEDLESNKGDRVNQLSKSIKNNVTQIDAELTVSENTSTRSATPISLPHKSSSELKPNYKKTYEKSQKKYSSKNNIIENKITDNRKTRSIKSKSVHAIDAVRVDENRKNSQSPQQYGLKNNSYSTSNETPMSVTEVRGKKSVDTTRSIENTNSHWLIKFGMAGLVLAIIYLLVGLVDFESIENTSSHQYKNKYKETDNAGSIEDESYSNEGDSLLNDYSEEENIYEDGSAEVESTDNLQENVVVIKQEEIILTENKEGNVEIIKSAGEVIIVVNDVDANEVDKNSNSNLIDASMENNISSEAAEDSSDKSIATLEEAENKTLGAIEKRPVTAIESDDEVVEATEVIQSDMHHQRQQVKHVVVDGSPEKPADIMVLNRADSIQTAESENILAADNKAKNKLSVQNKIVKPQSKKYIHLVVKGDTLWHIAKRYVNNPWRYPELAKLSKIKNPDLIYPGNKVIIIINYRKTTP